MSDKELPIAETFTSVQGEGAQVGMRMFFIRLAGCTVGKRYAPKMYSDEMFPIFVNRCTTFDGRSFPCDTDYRQKETHTVKELIEMTPKTVEWVSITGGEPLMHMMHVANLCEALRRAGKKYHIETSGTIMPVASILDTGCYFACSPKNHYLPEVVNTIADEIRLMVDKDFNIDAALKCISGVRGQVFLSPISKSDDIMAFDIESIAKCNELIAMPAFRHARISVQMHKLLNVR